MPISGITLRLERVAAKVTIVDLAAQMGRHRATVANYENAASVSFEVAREYRAALATLTEVATPPALAEGATA